LEHAHKNNGAVFVVIMKPARRAACMPFSGVAGAILVTFMGILSIVICIIRYMWEHRRGEDRRPARVYAYDMCKIAISQTAAWVVNLWITDQVFQTLLSRGADGEELGIEGIGWYTAVFLMDFVVGVPLGIWLGRLVNQQAEVWWTSYLSAALRVQAPIPRRALSVMTLDSIDDDELFDLTCCAEEAQDVPANCDLPWLPRWAEQNRIYGKYGRLHSGKYEEDSFIDTWGPALDGWWWWSQTASWSICVAVSRIFSGLVMMMALLVYNAPTNPIVLIATAVSEMPLTCAAKQWLIAGVLRIAVDVLQYLIIDAVNKFRTKVTYETV
jgi:hypothetical protein